MKNLEKIYKTFMIALLLITAASCSDDDQGTMAPANNTIADFVVANQANYSLLLEALQKADGDLVTTLSGNGPFTVFAPTNTAFCDLLTELGASSLDDIATGTLEATLNTHVVGAANVLSSTLTDGMMVSTLGDTFTINLS